MNYSAPVIINAITAQGMLPLFYHDDRQVSIEVVRALYKAGLRVVEYTNRGAAALENFKAIKQLQLEEMPGLHLGAGTIKSAAEAAAYIAAGADFLVSPIVTNEIYKIAAVAGRLWIPGCMTPTEIYTAQQYGAPLIKLFPASIIGTDFLTAIRDLFPDQAFIPTGGVELEAQNLAGWFGAGVSAVGVGSKLISKQILADRQYGQLHADTQIALKLIASVR